MRAHSSNVPGNQDPIIFGRDAQNLRIESAVGNCARCRPKIYRWLSSEQALPDVRIDISVGLKADFQASLVGASLLAFSKRSIMSWGMGYCALISSKMRSWSFR